MTLIKKLPLCCPSCESLLSVNRMHCKSCDTNVEGSYELPLLAQLNGEEQKFVISFLKSSGSIKEMASQMGMSYPTMRNMLDDLIEKVKTLENK
jgi:hypothetical protein